MANLIQPISTAPRQSTQDQSNIPTSGRPSLDKDDFLRLLTTQLTHQDPLNPQDEQQMVGTLAQFSSLEQITNLGDKISGLSTAGQWTQALSLLGKRAAADDGNGGLIQGVVQSVRADSSGLFVTVNGKEIPLSQVGAVGA